MQALFKENLRFELESSLREELWTDLPQCSCLRFIFFNDRYFGVSFNYDDKDLAATCSTSSGFTS